MSRPRVNTQVVTGDGAEVYRRMFTTNTDDPGSSLPPGLPALTVGWDVLGWVENNLKDPTTGEPWRLTREMSRFVLWFYAHDTAGRPIYTRAEMARCKGWGKSPLAATLAIVECCGPCRPGPGRAQPAAMPYVPVAGVSETGTETTMEYVRRLAKASPIELEVGLGRCFTPSGGVIEGVTSSPWSLEGRRPTYMVGEESQHWQTGNRGREMYRVALRNTAKAPDGWGRVFTVTNRHAPGLESVAEINWEAHVAGLPAVLYDCREGPPDVDLHDPDSVIRAVRAAAGDSTWVPAERLAVDAPGTERNTFLRYHLNRITATEESWIDAASWDQCVSTREIDPTERFVLGFDGSTGRTVGTADSTALVGVCLADMHLFLVGLWWQPPGSTHWTPPVDAIMSTVETWVSRPGCVGFGADPSGWEGIVAGWESKWADKLTVKAGPGSPIGYRFGRPSIVTRDTAALHDAITSGSITVDGSPQLRQHALNARTKTTAAGVQLRKEHGSSDRKIDAIVAGVIAYALALEARRTGADRPAPVSHVPYRIR